MWLKHQGFGLDSDWLALWGGMLQAGRRHEPHQKHMQPYSICRTNFDGKTLLFSPVVYFRKNSNKYCLAYNSHVPGLSISMFLYELELLLTRAFLDAVGLV